MLSVNKKRRWGAAQPPPSWPLRYQDDETRDVCPSQVLLPPYEEAIAIPPKEPPPQYMEAWEAYALSSPWHQPPLPPEQEHDSGWTPTPTLACIGRAPSPPVSAMVQGRVRDSVQSQNSDPTSRQVLPPPPHHPPPKTLRPDLLCTFLRAPVRPATVNLWYCDSPYPSPPKKSLSRINLKAVRSYTRALFSLEVDKFPPWM